MTPAVGMLATVRNRRGVITAVESLDGYDGRLHLVTLEYAEADGVLDDQLLWEREPSATLVPPAALPDVGQRPPMAAADFDALVRATRWGALQPFLAPDGPAAPVTAFPVSAPLHGAIQLEDFQLVPLLKALRMPRVTLLIADDVGLGKTIEAGLIIAELLLRRRVRRILILCPASLRRQWQREMHDKFAISFDVVDRDNTYKLRKQLGMDASPWRTFPRVITSYHYLRQADVLEDFRAASRQPAGSPRMPWDLLVVDEAHNLAPATFGEDSDLATMLGQLTPLFEHRLFLSATPHDGQTRRFTGLLERLDPVRFHKGPLLGAMKARVPDVLVRRLKREINAATSPPRFCERVAQSVPVVLGPGELALAAAVEAFRTKVKQLVHGIDHIDEQAGSFAVEVLRKRLLSGPATFADSWHRYRDGVRDDLVADAREVRAAERVYREDTDDDLEATSRAVHAVRTVGAWLKPMAEHLRAEVAAVERALALLALDDPQIAVVDRRPNEDCRFDALVELIRTKLCDGNAFRSDERLIVFTEYKTSLDYLEARLKQTFPGDGLIRVLFGGPELTARDAIIAAFNDPDDAIRILVATDAAAEGLNLQQTARYVLHWDVPWNPSRLEQRNGRLDRHGQARDVTTFHFTSDDDEDLRFVARVVEKIDTIRDDLGSFGEVFDVAFQQRFVHGTSAKVVEQNLGQGLLGLAARARVDRDATISTRDLSGQVEVESRRIEALCAELDLSPDTLRETLETALAIGVGRPRLSSPDQHGRVRLPADRIPPGWTALVDDTLRIGGGQSLGALPYLVFDPKHFVRDVGGRPVFRPTRDTTLLHLAHPLVHHALTSLAKLRFPGGETGLRATRWLVRRGPVSSQFQALLLVTLEERAVNELRETFHHWVRTVHIPVKDNELDSPLPHAPASKSLETSGTAELQLGCAAEDLEAARTIWQEVERDVKQFVKQCEHDLTTQLTAALATAHETTRASEQERFTSRQREIAAFMGQQSIAKLEREVAEVELEQRQGLLFDLDGRVHKLARSHQQLEDEMRRRTGHLEQLREQLKHERDRVIDHLLPLRFTLRGDARAFPVTVEIRLPEGR